MEKRKKKRRGGGSRRIWKLMGGSACFHYYIGNATKPTKPYKHWFFRFHFSNIYELSTNFLKKITGKEAKKTLGKKRKILFFPRSILLVE